MRIVNNVLAATGCRLLSETNTRKMRVSEQLSSGYRINRAADDASGLGISESMRSKINGLKQGSVNSQDGISLIQTIEGATHEVQGMLQRMKQLAVQSANGTNEDEDRALIQLEVKQLKDEIDRISDNTEFNGKKVLDGSASYDNQLSIQVEGKAECFINLGDIASIKCDSLNISDLSVSTKDGAKNAIDTLEGAIREISERRTRLGSMQNRLDHSIANTDNNEENMTASESRIRDGSIPDLSMENVRDDILLRATEYIIVQANHDPEFVLQLLGQ